MRICVPILLLILLLPFCSAAGAGQHPYYLSINRSNGLPSDNVYDICEDDDGFMWLATGNGLYRYDGFSFMPWQSETQTSAAGSCVRKDRFGRIWYENFDGFLYYTYGKALRPLNQKRSKAYMPFGITDKYLFVLQPQGVDVYDIETLLPAHHVPLRMKSLEHASCANGAYYVAGDGVIYKIDAGLKLTSYKIPEGQAAAVHQLFAVGDSLYIVPRLSGAGTITVLNHELQPVRRIPVAAPGYHRGIELINGTLWLYTSLGCMAAAGSNGSGVPATLFEGKSISKVLRDSNGNYWFATTNEGIYIVPDLSSKVHTYNTAKMRQVAVTPSGILAGTYTGELLRLRPEDGSIAEISSDQHGAEIYYLYTDDQSIIYSATGHTMLTGKDNRQTKVAAIAIKSVVAIDEKYYAVATSGMCLLMPKPDAPAGATSVWDTITSLPGYSGMPGSLFLIDGVRGRAVAYDSALHTIYCATNSGLVAAGTHNRHQVEYDGRSIYAAELAAFAGNIYIADARGSMLRMTRQGTVEALDSILPGTGPVRLLKVCNGHLYYCRGRRIYQYSGSTARQVNVPIDADEINDMAANDGRLWLATNAGLVSFAPDTRTDTTHLPRFFITAVMVNEAEADSARLHSLAFGENNITIGYSLVEFAVPAASALSYQVNEGEWKELPGNVRTLHFRSLSPGSYTIRFAVNGKDTGKQVTFHISPPFWQQLWFYIFGVLAVLFIVLAYYSYRMKARMRRAEQRQEKLLMEERLSRSMLTALRSQMNPHFFFNALNTVQAYIFTNEKSKASDYLAKLSMLTRTILEMSEAETVLLSNEIEALNLYLELERTRFGDDFKYQIAVDENVEPLSIEIPSMILQPFVENAVKHGLLHKEGQKLLHIRFAGAGNELHITIEDNGIGRARSEALNEIKNRKYKSYSTRATAERVKLLNAGTPDRIFVGITDKSTTEGAAGGTTVTIKIRF